jgi:hypothetical protein
MEARRALVVLLGATLLGGCLDEPEIEDRWTRLDVTNANVAPGQLLTTGVAQPFSVKTAVTYRAIVTGFAVTELRASTTISPANVELHPNGLRERMAQHIDLVLQNSVSLGRATRAVTGWDHLIQNLDLSFSATVPAVLDSAGTPLGPPVGLFLISYLGSGVEIELANGQDSLIVTPFPSAQYEILPVGMELGLAPPAPPPQSEAP